MRSQAQVHKIRPAKIIPLARMCADNEPKRSNISSQDFTNPQTMLEILILNSAVKYWHTN